MRPLPAVTSFRGLLPVFVCISLGLSLMVPGGPAVAGKTPVDMPLAPSRAPCGLGSVAVDWDFSVGPHDFYVVDCDNGGEPVWEYGPTDYIPDAPGSLWGTVLQTDYPNYSGSGLVSPAFFVDSGSHLVEVVHYVDTESGFDGCNVMADGQIIHPEGGYTVASINDSPAYYAYCVDGEPGWTGPDAQWRTDCFNLSPFMGRSIALEFDFGSDESVTAPGWYIARIRIGAPPVESHVCCLPDGTCELVTEEACLELQGDWYPELDDCGLNPCAPHRFLSIGGTYNPEPWNDWVGPEGAEVTLRADIPRDEGELPITAVEFFLSTDEGATWEFVGVDDDGTDPAFDSYGDAEPVGDGWTMVAGTPVPVPIPEPTIHYRAIAYPEVGEPLILESARAFDPAPPSLAQTNIEDWTEFHESQVEFVVDPNGADLERIVVLLAPKQIEFVKGIPGIDQHIHSEAHCAPTATAQCFRYFENHGDADLTGGLDDYELVGALGALMETDPVDGTYLGPWVAGVNSWVRSHGNNYTVRLYWYYSPYPYVPIWGLRDWVFIRNELEKCQDVLMGVYWHTGGGHAMTLNSIINEPLPNGRIQIGFTDPWTAGQTPAELDPETGELFDVGGPGGDGAQAGAAIIVCPRQDELTFGLPGEVQEDFIPDGDGPYAIPINIPGYGNWYVHIAVVNDMAHEHSISTIVSYQEGSDAPEEPSGTPESFALLACRPNPFPTETAVKFALPSVCTVRIAVYDLSGRRIRTIQDGQLPAGFHQRTWDGSDDRGREVSAGVYYVKMTAGGLEKVTKVAKIR